LGWGSKVDRREDEIEAVISKGEGELVLAK
jgi:hypothetical protein